MQGEQVERSGRGGCSKPDEHRVLCAPAIGGRWSDSAMKRSVSDDKKLDKMGFTKYVKAGDGIYEKRAGKGPDVINRDSLPAGGDD